MVAEIYPKIENLPGQVIMLVEVAANQQTGECLCPPRDFSLSITPPMRNSSTLPRKLREAERCIRQMAIRCSSSLHRRVMSMRKSEKSGD